MEKNQLYNYFRLFMVIGDHRDYLLRKLVEHPTQCWQGGGDPKFAHWHYRKKMK